MKLCGCLLDAEPAELPRLLSTSEVDLVEWRLDAFVTRYGQAGMLEMLAALGLAPRRPVLVTNRPKRQGGLYDGPEAERL
jgi:3-dehydroquinate dehydratase